MKTPDKLFYALAAICAVVVLAELGIDRHAHFGYDAIPGFNALFGFAAYTVLVLTATQLRKLLKRPADYYEPVDADPIREADATETQAGDVDQTGDSGA